MTRNSSVLKILAFAISTLGSVAGANAAADVGAAVSSCDQASQCAMGALNERYDPKNPGMGPRFIVDKARCKKLAAQCAKDMNSPEPK